jgi:ornithine cyclodeaminase
MKVLIVNQAEVTRLLPMDECIDLMAETLAAVDRGEAILPLRNKLALPDHVGVLGMMPAYLGNIDAVGLKVITVFHGNHGTKYDSHQGAVLLFETGHGQLLSIMDASSITAIRTAAVSGLATRLLAREDASRVAILGSGVQAKTNLEAMIAVRPVRDVVVWSRNADHAATFAERESSRYGIPVKTARDVRVAVEGADIICTTTGSRQPILEGDWIPAGCHINAVGSSIAVARELDAMAVKRSKLFVDRRESTLNEGGDFLIAKQEGAVSDEHILGEIGELLTGKIKGRTSRDDITLFKSLGIAVEDLASANHIYRKAIEQGLGTSVELGGERIDD